MNSEPTPSARGARTRGAEAPVARAAHVVFALALGIAATSGFARIPAAHAQLGAGEPSGSPVERARVRFEEGVVLARAGECARALVEFEASIALAPRPNAYFNAARCEERLRRFTRALADYRTFAAMADADDVARLRVAARIAALLAEVAVVHVEANVAAGVFVGGERRAETPASLEIDPGPVVIEVRADGYESAHHTLVLHAGERSALLVTLGRTQTDESITAGRDPNDAPEPRGARERGESATAPERGPGAPDALAGEPARDERAGDEAAGRAEPAEPAEPAELAELDRTGRAMRTHRRLQRGPFYAGIAATGSALAIGTGFGIHALVLRHDGERLDPYDADGREAARADVRRASQIADAGFFASAGFALATTVLGVFTDFDRDAAAPSLAVSPLVTTASLGLVLDGRFR